MVLAVPQPPRYLNINKALSIICTSFQQNQRFHLHLLILLCMLLLQSTKNYSIITAKKLLKKINKVACTLIASEY